LVYDWVELFALAGLDENESMNLKCARGLSLFISKKKCPEAEDRCRNEREKLDKKIHHKTQRAQGMRCHFIKCALMRYEPEISY
jgi:hypothetical protein